MVYEWISSRKNKAVRDAASLLSGAEKRSEAGLFILEGARLCADAAESKTEILLCFFTEEAKQKYGAFLDRVLAVSKEAYGVEPHVAALLSDTKHPQGIFCVCKMRAPENRPLAENARVLVLENVQDPANMGSILRTAEALGVRELCLLGACCDLYAPKTLRGSMGAVFRLAVRTFSGAADCAAYLRREGVVSLAAVPDRAAESVCDVPLQSGRFAAWIGNEGNGLTQEAVACCDRCVTIPMAGRAESLNAAAAAAILLWEMVRERGVDCG